MGNFRGKAGRTHICNFCSFLLFSVRAGVGSAMQTEFQVWMQQNYLSAAGA